MQETSLSLIERARHSPQSDSWHRLVDIYTPLLQRWIGSMDVQGADADDVIQEVFAGVAQGLPRFDRNEQRGAFRSWLRKILVYRLQNYWRAKKRHIVASGGTSMDHRLQQLEDDTSQLSRIWDEQHDQEVLTKLLEIVRPDFNPQTWEAFHRQVFRGDRPAQIAIDLNMKVGSVYMARNRVLTALRREAAGMIDEI